MFKFLTALVAATCVMGAGCLPISDSHMKVTSQAFDQNQAIPNGYTCDGDGSNPPLEISGVPIDAVSLVLIVDDPDAPSGDFVHWVVFDIPPNTTNIPVGWVPTGTVGQNGTGDGSWIAPCPPSGTHHYSFKVFALDAKLGLAPSATKTDVMDAMDGHIIGEAQLVGVYERKK